MLCYVMIGLSHWPILTLLHSFQHEGMLVFRTLGLGQWWRTYGTHARCGTRSPICGHAHRHSSTEFVTREGRGARLLPRLGGGQPPEMTLLTVVYFHMRIANHFRNKLVSAQWNVHIIQILCRVLPKRGFLFVHRKRHACVRSLFFRSCHWCWKTLHT